MADERPPLMGRWVWWLLALLLVGRLLLLCWLPLSDPTEGRYAQVAQEMAASADWVTPRIIMEGEWVPFLGKPPLFFWASALCVRVLGNNEFAYRVPNVAAAALLVLLVYRSLRRSFGESRAQFAAAATATCGLFYVLAGTVVVDVFLALCVGGAHLAYWAFSAANNRQERRPWSLLVFVLLAGGFLTKGPVAIAMFGMPVFLWTWRCRRWRDLRDHAWVPGIALFLALTAPWFVFAEMREPGFIKYFLLNENLLRFTVHDYGDRYGHGHDHFRGMAALMFVVAAMPWTLVGAWDVVHAARRHSLNVLWQGPAASFFGLAFAVNVAFWCLARQLLIAYMVPLIPAFCAWLAWRRVDPVRVPAFKRLAVVTAGLLLVGLTVAGPVTERTSTRAVIAAVREAYGGQLPPMVFVHKTPYSAYVYGRGRVRAHAKEKAKTAVYNATAEASPPLLVISEGYEEDLPPEAQALLRTKLKVGDWRVAEVAPLHELERLPAK